MQPISVKNLKHIAKICTHCMKFKYHDWKKSVKLIVTAYPILSKLMISH